MKERGGGEKRRRGGRGEDEMGEGGGGREKRPGKQQVPTSRQRATPAAFRLFAYTISHSSPPLLSLSLSRPVSCLPLEQIPGQIAKMFNGVNSAENASRPTPSSLRNTERLSPENVVSLDQFRINNSRTGYRGVLRVYPSPFPFIFLDRRSGSSTVSRISLFFYLPP